MRTLTANKPLSRLAVGLATVVLAATPAATAAVTTVYKCFDRNLAIVYTDQPCRGEQIDIDAGSADPAALAELARERQALSRAVEQRVADSRRLPSAAGTPEYLAGPPPVTAPEVYYPAVPGYYAPYGNVRARNAGRAGNDDRARNRVARSVPAAPPNGITNRTFR
jgi:hypothetical protein